LAALAAWAVGAVPAFGESSLPEEALVDQAQCDQNCFEKNDQKCF
jgi:hypothetical protein